MALGVSIQALRCEFNHIVALAGGDSWEVPPVTIPNTEVKLLGADGTAGEARWESR